MLFNSKKESTTVRTGSNLEESWGITWILPCICTGSVDPNQPRIKDHWEKTSSVLNRCRLYLIISPYRRRCYLHSDCNVLGMASRRAGLECLEDARRCYSTVPPWLSGLSVPGSRCLLGHWDQSVPVRNNCTWQWWGRGQSPKIMCCLVAFT